MAVTVEPNGRTINVDLEVSNLSCRRIDDEINDRSNLFAICRHHVPAAHVVLARCHFIIGVTQPPK